MDTIVLCYLFDSISSGKLKPGSNTDSDAIIEKKILCRLCEHVITYENEKTSQGDCLFTHESILPGSRLNFVVMKTRQAVQIQVTQRRSIPGFWDTVGILRCVRVVVSTWAGYSDVRILFLFNPGPLNV